MKKRIFLILAIFTTSASGGIIFSDDFKSGTLDKWTIGGRQKGVNIAEVVDRHGSQMAHLHHSRASTEITIEKMFDYDPNLEFSFDMEVSVASYPAPTSADYAMGGVGFVFRNISGDYLGLVRYIHSSSSWPFDTYNPDPTHHSFAIADDAGLVSYNLNVQDLLSNIDVDPSSVASVNFCFKAYNSGSSYNMSADVWVDNVTVCEVPTLEEIEIVGPNEVAENFSASYKAIAYYDDDSTRDVTDLALWSVEPEALATIDAYGVLHTERIDIPQEYITIYAQYTKDDITVEAEMTVQVSPLVDLQITGPQGVRGNCQQQYNLIAYYGNGHTSDVTDSALWRVEPQAIANIEAGLLCTEDIDELQNITIYAQYTSGGVTLEGETTIQGFPPPPYTFYVPADFQTIQEAINIAEHSDIIVVSPGTYTGPGNRDIDFLGKAITVRSIDPNDPNIVAATIIDYNGTWEDGHRGFYFHSGEDANSILDGFTITRGYSKYGGGGIHCRRSSPTITNCIIRNNTHGGIYCEVSSPTIKNCTFSENSADDGGGMTNFHSNPTVISCTFIGNSGGRRGGGMYNHRSNPTVTNCTFSENSAYRGGGMLNEDNSSPMLTNCTFSGNSAHHVGGGMFNIWNSDPTVTNCTITGNSAKHHAGGIYCFDASPTITNCTITGNSAQHSGGGILCYDSNPTITNCTISDNSADQGGGIFCEYTSSTITNCIFWGNQASDGPEIYLDDNSNAWVSYSDLESGEDGVYVGPYCTLNWGEGNIDEDPCFAFHDDYHLTAVSPCIDAGTNEPAGGLSTEDLDGNDRVLDGDGDTVDMVDMGAYEFNMNRPFIVLSTATVEIFATEGRTKVNDEVVGIRNCGGGKLKWQIIEDCPWLEVFPKAGTSTGEIDDVIFRGTGAGLEHGDYTYVVEVVGKKGVNTKREIMVILHVNIMLQVPGQYGTIQAAIDDCVDGDVVIVAPGTYKGDGNRDIDFLGKAITVQSIDPNDTNIVAATIIDCNGTEAEPHRGFYFHNNENANSILDGLTVTNGYASGSWPESCGGGIYCRDSSPIITNCTISDNSARWGGGGIYCNESSPTITNCSFSNNLSYYRGGGIYVDHSSPNVLSCRFIRNKAADHPNRAGGAVMNNGGRATISNCLFAGNTAGGGGAICNYGSHPKITNCTFCGNSASWNGGGVQNSGFSHPTLTNCILWGNKDGNGMGESAQIYGGSYNFNSPLIDYCCVQGWTGHLGGIGNIDSDPCFVEPGYWDSNGTPDEPRDDFWVDGDYHLLAGSLCIDAGDNTAVPADTTDLDADGNTTEPIPFDLDGNPRIVDGNDDGNLVVDMGAFEAMVSCFGVNHLKVGTKADKKGNEVELKGTFDPAVPIELLRDDVAYIIDDGLGNALAFLIPAGSFEVDGKPDKQKFKFHSAKGSQPDIKAKFDFDKCKFELKAKRVQGTDEITSTTLTIELWAGANVAQELVEVKIKPRHLEYKREPKLNCCPKCKGIALLEVTSDQGVFVFEPEPGKDKLKANTVVDDGVNGPVKIDTSCSKPIDVGDVFGAYTVTDLIKIFDDCPDDD